VSTYRLSLFGGFDLRDDQGAEIAISSKKGRCLLAYLALGQGRKASRDTLAAHLWGDRGDAQARRSLSQELYRLRGLFSEEAQESFVLEAESVALAADLFETDAVSFERGLDAGDCTATSLYTGDLLAGQETNQEGFDDWLGVERARLRERAVAALYDCLRARLSGPAEAAQEAANRVLALDPASEEAHRALMQLHADAGRRDLALKQYDKCREILSTGLGIEPEGATTGLYEQIKSEAPAAPAAEPTGGAADSEALALPDKPSIAVLPFNNMSGDPEQDYFSDGIAEDIITALSGIRDLFVIARNSSFVYRGDVDIKQVGSELGVRYVLEGGVRKAGQKVRINTQLIDAESGNHLWARKFDGDLIDIFDLQDQITESVAGVVQSSIFQAEIDRVRRKRPEIMDDYEMCMRGWFSMTGVDQEGLRQARESFQKAIDMDGWLSLAYTGLAGSLIWETTQGLSDDPNKSMSEALAAAQRAGGIDEADADAHGWLAFVSLFSVPPRLDVALAESERAVELSPNSAMARWSRGLVFSFAERPDDGAKDLKLALRLSPRDWRRFSFLHVLALCQYTARNYDESAETATKLVALLPDYLYGHWHLAGSLAQLGQTARAEEELRHVLRVHPNFDRAFVAAWAPYRNPADLEHLFEGLEKAGWKG